MPHLFFGEQVIAKKKPIERSKAARASVPDEARELAKLCARIADDKKGERIVILRMTELIGLLDYFVIAGGSSRPQVQAIADEINETMRKLRVPCRSMEGYEDGRWVLLDCGTVVVHVFETMTRDFYDLEHLWADAPRVRWRGRKGVRTLEPFGPGGCCAQKGPDPFSSPVASEGSGS